jgi:hypothetical protein
MACLLKGTRLCAAHRVEQTPGGQLQRQLCEPPTTVGLDRSQQAANLVGICDGRVVLDDGWFQQAPQVEGDIARAVPEPDPMPKDLSAALLGPPCCLEQSFRLDFLQNDQKILAGD